MSAEISQQQFRHIFIKVVGSDKLSHDKAKALGIDNNEFSEANENDSNYIEIDEAFKYDELSKLFATKYEEELNKKAEEKDAEKEKEEKNKVKDKNGAGAA